MTLNLFQTKTLFAVLFTAVLSLNASMANHRELSSSTPTRMGFGISTEYMSFSSGFKEHFGGTLGAGNYGNSSHAAKTFNLAPVVEIGSFINETFYLGMLASWHYSNAHHKARSYLDRQYYFTHELKMTSYTTALLKAGYKVTKGVMAYGLVGPSFAKWRHTSIQYQKDRIVDRFDMKRNSWGLSLGGGVEFDITNKSALSFDYTHTIYRRQKAVKTVSYQDRVGLALMTRTGPLTKSIQPSHGVLSLKYTYFF